MDTSVNDSTLMEKSDLSLQESTLINDTASFSDTDPTLTFSDTSLLASASEDDVSESQLHANVHPEPQEEVSRVEDEISKHASIIVDEAIDSASLSLRSSGDFSMLSDAQSLLAKSEVAENQGKVKNEAEQTEENNKSNAPDKEKEWLDILGNGLLKKKVLEPGQGETTRPQRGQEVMIEIASFKEDGSSLELSTTSTFIVADNDVPEGIDMAVNLMEKGEKCKLECDAKYCQYRDGRTNSIPKKGMVIFHIELQEIQDGPYNTSVAIEKRLLWVDTKRTLGNHLYSLDMFEDAQHAYTKCNRVLRQASNQQQSEENTSKIKELTLKCHNNLSATLIKLEKWKDALQACLIAENLDEKNIKTLFRKGTIYAQLGQFQKSVAAFGKASALSPTDKALQRELKKQRRRLEEQNKEQKEMYKRMLGGGNESNPEKSEKTKKSWLSSSVFIGSSLVVLGTALLVGYMMHR